MHIACWQRSYLGLKYLSICLLVYFLDCPFLLLYIPKYKKCLSKLHSHFSACFYLLERRPIKNEKTSLRCVDWHQSKLLSSEKIVQRQKAAYLKNQMHIHNYSHLKCFLSLFLSCEDWLQRWSVPSLNIHYILAHFDEFDTINERKHSS